MHAIVKVLRVVLAFATITIGATGTLASEPVASPVPEGACTVEPRSPEEYAALIGTVAPGESVPPRNGGQLRDSIPAGIAVDETTSIAITAVLADVVACVNAGDLLRLSALYTDHAIYARGPINNETLEENLRATPAPSSSDDRIWIDQIHSVGFLPDAQVSAIVTIGGINEIDPYPGKTFVFIFAMTSDGWRIDDQFDEVLSPDGTKPVSVEEYLAG